jgi:hypothetical protein
VRVVLGGDEAIPPAVSVLDKVSAAPAEVAFCAGGSGRELTFGCLD